jgi:hypothetical protein
MRTALFVVTHEFPDDVACYDRFWQHMSSSTATVIAQCARSTILLWNALCETHMRPWQCELRRVGPGFVIHIHMYHSMERGTPFDDIHANDAFVKRDDEERDFVHYGKRTCALNHSWYKVFARPIHVVHAVMHRVRSHCASIAFFDENVVERACRHSHVEYAFTTLHTTDHVTILADRHAHERSHHVIGPHREEEALDDRGATRPARDAVFASAFIVPLAHMSQVYALFSQAATSHERQNMIMISICSACNVVEVNPPVFFDMDEYLAQQQSNQLYEHIEAAIVDVQRKKKSGHALDAPCAVTPDHVHQIWVGGPVPDRWQREHERIVQLHGRSRVTLWGNQDLARLPTTLSMLHLFNSHSALSDTARLEILYRHGGYYVDMDFTFARSMFALSRGTIGMCRENVRDVKSINGAFICSSQYNLFMLKFVSYAARAFVFDAAKQWMSAVTSGPFYLSTLYKCTKGKICMRTGAAVVAKFPSSFFYHRVHRFRKGVFTPSHTDPTAGFGRHLYSLSWL